MNSKAQMDIFAFIYVVVGLLILAPIILYASNTILTPFSAQINSVSSEASANVDYVQNTMVSFWDKIIGVAFLINVISLFVFSFLVDTHPIFSLFYLIGAIITMMFSHYVIIPIETLFGMSEFSTEVLQLPITGFILNQFDIILLAIIILTGIITYSKFSIGGYKQ